MEIKAYQFYRCKKQKTTTTTAKSFVVLSCKRPVACTLKKIKMSYEKSRRLINVDDDDDDDDELMLNVLRCHETY